MYTSIAQHEGDFQFCTSIATCIFLDRSPRASVLRRALKNKAEHWSLCNGRRATFFYVMDYLVDRLCGRFCFRIASYRCGRKRPNSPANCGVCVCARTLSLYHDTTQKKREVLMCEQLVTSSYPYPNFFILENYLKKRTWRQDCL